MKEWLTDEEIEEDRRNSRRLKAEAWAYGIGMIALALVVVTYIS